MKHLICSLFALVAVVAVLAAQPVIANTSSLAACGGDCTNKVTFACGGCTNGVTLACGGDCTNKVTLACGGCTNGVTLACGGNTNSVTLALAN